MTKNILYIAFMLFPCLGYGECISCFTHPLCTINEPISLYSEPDKYICELYISGDGGYEVCALTRVENYIAVLDLPCGRDTSWVHIGDVGVVAQIYDQNIPIYSQNDSLSTILGYLSESHIGILYDWDEKYVLVKIKDDNIDKTGWLNRGYICGSPYTTCN